MNSNAKFISRLKLSFCFCTRLSTLYYFTFVSIIANFPPKNRPGVDYFMFASVFFGIDILYHHISLHIFTVLHVFLKVIIGNTVARKLIQSVVNRKNISNIVPIKLTQSVVIRKKVVKQNIEFIDIRPLCNRYHNKHNSLLTRNNFLGCTCFPE